MPIGWIDFSKTERNKVLNVLDLLSEPGTLDELGIAPVRDGFADLFFPGTSTIQTRAKYFLIVPYALKDLEYSRVSDPRKLLQIFDEKEKSCAKALIQSSGEEDGIVGRRALGLNSWVKRTPADIYWGGLRSFGIFKGGNMSLSEYIRTMCKMKTGKAELLKAGYSGNPADGRDGDDKDAGDLFRMQFWSIPTYREDWFDNLSLRLTTEEAAFLKEQIITSFPESMMAYIMRNDLTASFECSSFQELAPLITVFPDSIRRDYDLACAFSHFLFLLRTVFNMILSEGMNQKANSIWEERKSFPSLLPEAELESIFNRLQVNRNVNLCSFLRKARNLVETDDLEGLKTEISRREKELKQSRAKTLHPGEFDANAWFGGGELDYRFSNAKVIMRDITESGGGHV